MTARHSYLSITPITALLALHILLLNAQQSPAPSSGLSQAAELIEETEFEITEKTQDTEVLVKTQIYRNPDGTVFENKKIVTALRPGKYFIDDETQELTEARAKIELFGLGAVLRTTQHKMIFSPNINDPEGAIDVQSRDGKRLRSSPLAISYYDVLNDSEVILAVAQDSIGEQLSDTVIIYRNAFDEIDADVLVTVNRNGYEQDVILRESPLPPEIFGLDPDYTRLEVLTEFFNVPEIRTFKRKADTHIANKGRKPSKVITDETLYFGDSRIILGRAFLTEELPPDTEHLGSAFLNVDDALPVSKEWRVQDGRNVLYESVSYRAGKDRLERLAAKNENNNNRNGRNSKPRSQLAKREDRLPERNAESLIDGSRIALTGKGNNSWREKTGFIVDYHYVGGTVSNMSFYSMETYLIDGFVNCSGTTTFYPHAVIKFDSGQWRSGFLAVENVNWLATGQNPVIFAELHDDTIGEDLGTWYTTDPDKGLYFYPANSSDRFQIDGAIFRGDFREAIKIQIGSNYPITLANIQFQDCDLALKCVDVEVEGFNLLFSDVGTAVNTWNSTKNVSIEHATFKDVSSVNHAAPHDKLILTNSIVAGASNDSCSSSSAHNLTNSTSSSIFVSAGYGNAYLRPDSGAIGVGSTNISATVKDILASRTTSPSVIIEDYLLEMDTEFRRNVNLGDPDSPDLGFHYLPVDYAINDLRIKDCRLTVLEGVNIAAFGDDCIQVDDGGELYARGSSDEPVRFLWYQAVQEGIGWWGDLQSSGAFFVVPDFVSGPSDRIVDLEWTEFFGFPTSNYFYHIYLRAYNENSELERLSVDSCKFYLGNSIQMRGGATMDATWWNNLFHMESAYEYTYHPLRAFHVGDLNSGLAGNIAFRYNLFQGVVGYWEQSSGTFEFKDNTWEQYGSFWSGNQPTLTRDYNGNPKLPGTTGPNSIASYELDYDWFSDLEAYLVTGMVGNPSWVNKAINGGSETVASAGFYHYTTTADHVKDTGTVDMGIHYVAEGGDGLALDSDSDGVPDYVEDADGDGLVDSGETDWQDGSDPGLMVQILQPSPGAVVP